MQRWSVFKIGVAWTHPRNPWAFIDTLKQAPGNKRPNYYKLTSLAIINQSLFTTPTNNQKPRLSDRLDVVLRRRGRLFKIVITGVSAVGKSNLLSRYSRDEFIPNSKAALFQTQSLNIDGPDLGQRLSGAFRAVTSAYYRVAVGALLVYDISRRTPFESIGRWLDEHKTHFDATVERMLVGYKCDLENFRDVSVEEGKSFAESEGLFFMETSALDSTNVKAAFKVVIKEIYNNVSRKVLNSDVYKAKLSVNQVPWLAMGMI